MKKLTPATFTPSFPLVSASFLLLQLFFISAFGTAAESKMGMLHLSAGETLTFQCSQPGGETAQTLRLKNGSKHDCVLLKNMRYVPDTPNTLFHGNIRCVVSGNSFRDSDLSGSNFSRVTFRDSSFAGAVLSGTLLCVDADCRFDGANIAEPAWVYDQLKTHPGIRIAGMTGGQLMQTKSGGKYVVNCVFIAQQFAHFNFEKADMRHVQFGNHYHEKGGYLFDAGGSSLQGSRFTGADARYAHFEGQNMQDCRFTDTFLQHARFVGCDTKGAEFDDARIEHAEFWKMTSHQLRQTKSYKTGNLTGIKLYAGDLKGVDLSRCNLTEAEFMPPENDYYTEHATDLTDADLTDAIITGCIFCRTYVDSGEMKDVVCGVNGLTAKQIKSTWNYRNKQMDGIALPPKIAEELGLKPIELRRE